MTEIRMDKTMEGFENEGMNYFSEDRWRVGKERGGG